MRRDLANGRHRRMPLHFGKIFAAIALLTVAAFVLWLRFTTFFATERAEEKIEHLRRSASPRLLSARRSACLATHPSASYLTGKYEDSALRPGSRKTLFNRLGRYEKGNGPR